jgi:hypothetical protein
MIPIVGAVCHGIPEKVLNARPAKGLDVALTGGRICHLNVPAQ